jgi:copper(I)-binding protein
VTSIAVPAYGSAELKPGAMFVRLSELKAGLKAGDEVKLTLETDGGVSIEIAAAVK